METRATIHARREAERIAHHMRRDVADILGECAESRRAAGIPGAVRKLDVEQWAGVHSPAGAHWLEECE